MTKMKETGLCEAVAELFVLLFLVVIEMEVI